jgi:DNA-binding NtrC family response regulator
VEPSAEQGTYAPAATRERLDGSETILVVDDTETVRRLTRDVLSRAGYQVLEAAGVDEALTIASSRREPLDLLVTDVVMPGSNGVDLVGRLRTKRPELRVLYISGYTDMAVVRQGLLDDAAAFLQKPFTPEDLLRRVRQALEAA